MHGAKTIEPNFDQIAAAIIAEVPLAAILVFGSFASGRNRADSDLDIALVGAEDLSHERLQRLKDQLAYLALRDIDLIDFSEAPPPLQAEIMRNSIKICVINQEKMADEFMKALRNYQKLNEERRPSLDKRLGKDGWKRLF